MVEQDHDDAAPATHLKLRPRCCPCSSGLSINATSTSTSTSTSTPPSKKAVAKVYSRAPVRDTINAHQRDIDIDTASSNTPSPTSSTSSSRYDDRYNNIIYIYIYIRFEVGERDPVAYVKFSKGLRELVTELKELPSDEDFLPRSCW